MRQRVSLHSASRLVFLASSLSLLACDAGSTESPNPEPEVVLQPVQIPLLAPFHEHVLIGDQLTCVVEKEMVCAGKTNMRVPSEVTDASEIYQWEFGLRSSCQLNHDGLISCLGENLSGVDGDGDFATATFRSLSAGWFHYCGLSDQAEAVCWGSNRLGQLGADKKDASLSIHHTGNTFLKLASGAYHNCGIDPQGAVKCWGDGDYGQLGQGEEEGSITAVSLKGIDRAAVDISVGDYHSCAIDDEANAWCWGSNRFGQLGDGTRTRRNKAVAVSMITRPVTALATGGTFSCALHMDSTVSCWGSDLFGEIARGSDAPGRIEADTPVLESQKIALPDKAVSIHAAGLHACAVLENQEVWCWGANESGQLGDGSRDDQFAPVRWLGKTPGNRIPTLDEATEIPRGIDVSYHAGRIRWGEMAKHGIGFAYNLATAGMDFKDPFFMSNWDRLEQSGIRRGAYHFYIPADDPVSQAQLFLSHVHLQSGDLLPVVDVEVAHVDDPTQLANGLRTFSNEIYTALGVRPMIYTSPNFWNKHFSGTDFSDLLLWIAEYDVDKPNVPSGWSDWTLWQWEDNESIKNAASDVDLNRLNSNVRLSDLVLP